MSMTGGPAQALRRYLLWIGYDGSRFPEMAHGGTGFGVMDFLHQLLAQSIYGVHSSVHPLSSPLKLSPSSRTDSGVHAIRSAVILQVPIEKGILDATVQQKKVLLKEWNEMSQRAFPNGLSITDFHSVSAGFCIRRSVQYRRYTYRLAIRKSGWNEQLAECPGLVCFSERPYAWILPAGFDLYKARNAAKPFKGEHVLASFFKHTARERRLEPNPPDAVRNIYCVQIDRGEAYTMPNDLYEYYNVTIVARSFLREQIRRMVACIVSHGYGGMSLSQIRWLLNNPEPTNYYSLKLNVAPPNGLFLTDVVYNPDHYTSPIPYFRHSWDYELP